MHIPDHVAKLFGGGDSEPTFSKPKKKAKKKSKDTSGCMGKDGKKREGVSVGKCLEDGGTWRSKSGRTLKKGKGRSGRRSSILRDDSSVPVEKASQERAGIPSGVLLESIYKIVFSRR